MTCSVGFAAAANLQTGASAVMRSFTSIISLWFKERNLSFAQERPYRSATSLEVSAETLALVLRLPSVLLDRVAHFIGVNIPRSSQLLRATVLQSRALVPEILSASQTNLSTCLLRLPIELLLFVVTHLEREAPMTLNSLRLVSRRLYRITPIPKIKMQFSILELLQHSSLANLRNMFACMYCLRLRHLSKFVLTLPHMKRKANGNEFHVPPYCADCGFEKPYPRAKGHLPGTLVCVDGVPWIKCHYCEEIKKEEDVTPGCRGWCNTCRDLFRGERMPERKK